LRGERRDPSTNPRQVRDNLPPRFHTFEKSERIVASERCFGKLSQSLSLSLCFSLLLSDTDGYKPRDITAQGNAMLNIFFVRRVARFQVLFFFPPRAPPRFTLPTTRGSIHPSLILDLGLLRGVTNGETAHRLPSRRAIIPGSRFTFKRALLRNAPRRGKLLSS